MAFDKGGNILREWAPLTDLFNQLPVKHQAGIFAQDVKLTCVDVLPEFLALGTNLGVVYWYDRKKKDLQRLRCEKQNIPVTVVKIISSVDYMVACGSKDGSINIYQIPKSHPDSIPENLKPKNKQVERYTVSDLHKSPITAIEWSKNGMKLFSGDKSGCIVLTELDFYMHICKSLEILNESYEVVQLSYSQQRLLISTTYRTIVCCKQDKWKVCQVGKKDRKMLGTFGGIIYQNGLKSTDAVLYCSRPGLRIWVADCDGNVTKTLLFKDLLRKECAEVPIINPISKNMKALKPYREPSFGVLLSFSDNLLLTFNNDVIYILDPEKMTIVTTMSLFRSVLWVETCKDEIFVLEEDRSLIRISYKPENFSLSDTVDSTVNSPLLPITNSLREITSKLQATNIIPAISPFSENTENYFNVFTDNALVMNAEEATESPTRTKTENSFNNIGKQGFQDQILFKHGKTRKKQSSIMCASTSSLSSNSSEEKDVTASYIRPTVMNLSTVGILPDLRSPESILNDIEYKEKILADVLSFDTVKIPLDKLEENSLENCDIDDVEAKRLSNFIISDNYNKIGNFETVPEPTPSSTILTKVKKPEINKMVEVKNTEPACLSIPNDWKLADIHLNSKNDASLSDTSLADWEIV